MVGVGVRRIFLVGGYDFLVVFSLGCEIKGVGASCLCRVHCFEAHLLLWLSCVIGIGGILGHRIFFCKGFLVWMMNGLAVLIRPFYDEQPHYY